jgi:chromosome partitioning protein
MRLIAIFNQKGGSGKTTTAVNLAAALGEQDRHVLVFDLDPQASASSWLGVKDGGRGLLDVFTDGLALAGLIQPTSADGVDVIPSSTWLVGAEKALAGEVGAETILRRRLAALKGPWQYILIDCPPALGLLTVNALAAAQEVLVTVESHVMALSGLARLLETLEVIKAQPRCQNSRDSRLPRECENPSRSGSRRATPKAVRFTPVPYPDSGKRAPRRMSLVRAADHSL